MTRSFVTRSDKVVTTGRDKRGAAGMPGLRVFCPATLCAVLVEGQVLQAFQSQAVRPRNGSPLYRLSHLEKIVLFLVYSFRHRIGLDPVRMAPTAGPRERSRNQRGR